MKNTLDVDGDLALVQSSKSNVQGLKMYANAFTYTSAGAVSSMRLGNGKFENTTFNSRLQPIQIGLGSSATSQNLLKLNFDYGGTDNNGNVKSQQITVQQGNQMPLILNQNYMYDSLNRLKSAEEKDVNNAQVWKQTYVFDRYGNRNFDATNNNTTNLTGTLPKVTNPEILPTNNRLKADQDGDNVVDYLYDASGNLIQDVDNKRFGYDAENKQVRYFASNNQTATPNGTYFFDGDGKRVKKISPTETTIYVYDAGGKLVAEYSTQQADTPKINYTTNDHLGSPRIKTDGNGAVISRVDYQPYGEEIASTQRTANLGYTVQDTVKQGFTGYIKDDETGLDFAQARMYKNSLGRFTGADYFINDTNVISPQSWNLYVYVRNNPHKYTDPSGREIWLTINGESYQYNHSGKTGSLGGYSGNDEVALAAVSYLNTMYEKNLRGPVFNLMTDSQRHTFSVSATDGAATGSTDYVTTGEDVPGKNGTIVTKSVISGTNSGIEINLANADDSLLAFATEVVVANTMGQQTPNSQLAAAPNGTPQWDQGYSQPAGDNPPTGSSTAGLTNVEINRGVIGNTVKNALGIGSNDEKFQQMQGQTTPGGRSINPLGGGGIIPTQIRDNSEPPPRPTPKP